MKIFRKFISLALCAVVLLSFAACTGKDNGETTASSTSQNETEQTKSPEDANNKENDDSRNLLITLYNAESDEYHALQGETEYLDTGIDGAYGMTGFRFVSPQNGVKVRLEGIMWSPIVDEFECDRTYFEIETEKGKIYEFCCSVTETIPDFRLVAEYNGKKSEYYMVTDGESAKNVIEMKSEDFVPEEITEDSVFYNLCVARAASKIFYEGYVEHDNPAVVWDTVVYAVTLNYLEMNGDTEFDEIYMTKWELESYMNSMYPEYTGNYPVMSDECSIRGSMRQYSDYDVTPVFFENFCTDDFYGVENNGNGTYSVKIRIDDYRFEGYEEFGLAVIVKPDANSPFGYVITDVVDCELPRG